MNTGFVELGRIAWDWVRRLLAQEHPFVGYGPNCEPVARFSETGWPGGSPHHAQSEGFPSAVPGDIAR